MSVNSSNKDKTQSKEEDSFRLAEQKEKINACLSFEEKMREHSIKITEVIKLLKAKMNDSFKRSHLTSKSKYLQNVPYAIIRKMVQIRLKIQNTSQGSS